MSTITTAPGLVSIDPITGLVDYVKDIKPYHTKIFEVLFEYIYTDNVNTTVKDTLMLNIDDNQTYFTSTTDPAIPNQGSIPANSFWYNPTSETLYVRGNYLNPTFVVGSNVIKLAGNYTSLFTNGFVFNISGTGTADDGSYKVTGSTFDGTYTEITTTPISGGTSSFVAAPSSTGTYYYNGYQLFLVSGDNKTLIYNVIVQNSAPPYGTTAAYWYNNATNMLYSWNGSAYVPVTLGSGILGYWSQFQTNLASNPGSNSLVETTVTEFVETIAFNWGANSTHGVVSTNLSANQVSITGNLANAFHPEDITELEGLVSTITNVEYDPSTNTTVVTMAAVPTTVNIGAGLTIQNIDITYWYEFAIVSVNPANTPPSQSSNVENQGNPSDLASPRSLTNGIVAQIELYVGLFGVPSITVSGNATTSVQVGALFTVAGSTASANNGTYYAAYVQYEPIANTTTIGIGSTIGFPAPTMLTATGGGQVIPYRFINEVPQGSYDNGGYDANEYDQSGGSIIYQGP
jgi:hypothetical protein